MRRAAAGAFALLSLAVGAPAFAQEEQEQQAYPWGERVAAAGDFAQARAGRVSWAVVTPAGRVRGQNIHARHSSASVVKAMLLVSYLNHGDVPRRPLRASEKGLLRPMVLRSDSRSATRVRDTVGNAALSRLARRVRMKDFATARSWGSTQVSAHDQARFFWRVHAYVPKRHRDYARSLLGGVVERHRWGIPPAVPDGWRVYFKGGWVQPRLANQAALVQRGRRRIAIAVLTDGNPSFEYGQRTIEGVARRVLMDLNLFRV